MKQLVQEDYVSRFSDICYELQFCINKYFNGHWEHASVDIAVSDIDWIFFCEWDCDIDDWYANILG